MMIVFFITNTSFDGWSFTSTLQNAEHVVSKSLSKNGVSCIQICGQEILKIHFCMPRFSFLRLNMVSPPPPSQGKAKMPAYVPPT